MKKFVVANWKQNPQNLIEAKQLFASIKRVSSKFKTSIVVCPPSVFISSLTGTPKCSIGAQDISINNDGAHTGEISAQMVQSVGATFVIIGHSENRLVGDTDLIVNQKIKNAINANLCPILCVGETVRDKDGLYLSYVESQVVGAFAGIDKKDFKKIIIAYEPVWAVSKSEKTALRGKDIHEATLFIRKVLSNLFGKNPALSAPILYGGSVFVENVSEIMNESECQGLLVGRQSLDAKAFAEIIKVVSKS